MHENLIQWIPRITWTVALAGMGLSFARADVVDLSASCQATVIERVGGKDSTTDSKTERYPETISVLPMSTEAGITTTAGDVVKGIGLSFCRFRDPNTKTGSIPAELNVDAATYSDDPELGYEVTGEVVERRRVRFTPGQTGVENGEEVELASTFYIRGLLVALAERSGKDLSGVLARVEVTVVHARPGRTAQTVMSATYELIGQADGTVKLATSGQADLDQVSDIDLTQFTDALGVLRISLLPAVAVPYQYTATVGQESELTARLSVKLISTPDGTGVAAAFGMPGQTLGQALDAVLGNSTGTQIVRAINTSVAALQPPGVDQLIEPGLAAADFLAWFLNLCGGLGAESAVGLGVLLGWPRLQSRRRFRS